MPLVEIGHLLRALQHAMGAEEEEVGEAGGDIGSRRNGKVENARGLSLCQKKGGMGKWGRK